MAVGRRPDADREETTVAKALADDLKELFLVAHFTVGQKNHLTQPVGRGLRGERPHERGKHLGAAGCPDAVDVPLGRLQILAARRLSLGEEAVGTVIEAHDVEAVARLKPCQRELERSARLLDRRPGHRAGVVEHEDHFARRAPALELAGRHQHQQRVRAIAGLVGEERRRRFGARGGLPDQLEIAIGRHLDVLEADLEASPVERRGVDAMVGRLECRERHAGIELDAKAYRVDRATARWSDERRDSRSIGDGIGVGRPALPARDGQRHAGDVAWTDDHREAESEAPRVVPYGVLILDLDRDGRTGRDVGQRRGKDVRPLLLDEARALAFMLGLLVGGLGRGALLDDTVDDPVPDPHAQVIDGGVVGQGEDV